MLEDLPRLIISFIVILLVGIVGLGLAQQALDTVKFPAPAYTSATDDMNVTGSGNVTVAAYWTDQGFNGTALNLATSIDSAFGWLPMLILAAVGGIAIAYVFGFTNIMNRPQ